MECQGHELLEPPCFYRSPTIYVKDAMTMYTIHVEQETTAELFQVVHRQPELQ